MNCKDLEEKIVAYLDGELSVEEKENTEAHLNACPRCYQIGISFQDIRETYQSLEEVEVSPKMERKLKEAVAGGRPAPWREIFGLRKLRWAAMTIAGAAMVTLAIVILWNYPPRVVEIASLSETSGKIEILRRGERMWQAAHPEEVINVGDRLRTDSSGRATFTLGETGKVKMYFGTDLEFKGGIPFSAGTGIQCLLKIERGEIWAKVSPGKMTKFQVETSSGLVEVKGTEFYVRERR